MKGETQRAIAADHTVVLAAVVVQFVVVVAALSLSSSLLRLFLRRLIFIKVAVQRFYTHIAAVRQKVRRHMVSFLHSEGNIRLYP